MKQCPQCRRTYDDAQKFCAVDGAPLAGAAEAAPAPTPAAPAPHADPMTISRLECQWCQAQNETAATSCRACGAPLDVRNLVSESGWREAPRLKDMTELSFGNSTCQVEGEIVPVAEINLGHGDSVFFEHHVLLWKDETTRM